VLCGHDCGWSYLRFAGLVGHLHIQAKKHSNHFQPEEYESKHSVPLDHDQETSIESRTGVVRFYPCLSLVLLLPSRLPDFSFLRASLSFALPFSLAVSHASSHHCLSDDSHAPQKIHMYKYVSAAFVTNENAGDSYDGVCWARPTVSLQAAIFVSTNSLHLHQEATRAMHAPHRDC